MKRNFPFVIAITIFLLIVGKSFFMSGSTQQEPKLPAVTESKQVEVPTTEVGKFISSRDWAETTPGKALAEVVGQEWVNWIIWPIVILIIILVVKSFLPSSKGKGGGSSINLTGILMAAVMTATAAGIYGFVDLKKDERKYDQLPIKVDMTKLRYEVDGKPGESKELLMRLNNIATVQLRPVHVNEPGEGYLWACPEVADASLYDKVVMFQVVGGGGTNQNLIAIAPDSESYLYSKYGLINMRVKFTLMRAWDKPCPYLLTK
jgi:hypothetical protein